MIRRRRPVMTLEEARRIVEQARSGRLDTSDPSIARAVGEAQQVLTRAVVWGEDAATRGRSRGVVVVVLGGIALFITGLTLALALTVHP